MKNDPLKEYLSYVTFGLGWEDMPPERIKGRDNEDPEWAEEFTKWIDEKWEEIDKKWWDLECLNAFEMTDAISFQFDLEDCPEDKMVSDYIKERIEEVKTFLREE